MMDFPFQGPCPITSQEPVGEPGARLEKLSALQQSFNPLLEERDSLQAKVLKRRGAEMWRRTQLHVVLLEKPPWSRHVEPLKNIQKFKNGFQIICTPTWH